MAFRSLFNRPEVILLLRGPKLTTPYWLKVLDYSANGNLQAVMDEYVHVVIESLGHKGAESNAAHDISEHIHDAIALRTVALSHDEFDITDDTKISILSKRMRCRFALRFGDGDAEEGGEPTREDQVRCAFNSPFWPFILASTSVGQEGLDFHPYCHAIYHWNLPSNPVDMEQREGRIHRYKGHVIRKNLAAKYTLSDTEATPDPWESLFNRAILDRNINDSDLMPYWVLNGPSKIERRIPMLHLSREMSKLEDLKKSLALYRLVFGQPRQEELLQLLRQKLKAGAGVEEILRNRIDLSPPEK